MSAKVKNPSKGAHVQLTGPNTKGLMKIAKKSRRSLGSEVNMAIAQYVHRYVDNGK